MPGAMGSPWDGFEVSGKLEFPMGYPEGSISIFLQPVIFHPNIHPSDGLMCDISIKSEGIKKVKTCKNYD